MTSVTREDTVPMSGSRSAATGSTTKEDQYSQDDHNNHFPVLLRLELDMFKEEIKTYCHPICMVKGLIKCLVGSVYLSCHSCRQPQFAVYNAIALNRVDAFLSPLYWFKHILLHTIQK